jgi:hypothetical protein
VIPIRLDDAEVPVLLSAKYYVDLRKGLSDDKLEKLAETIIKYRSRTTVNRLLPTEMREKLFEEYGQQTVEWMSHEASLLVMIIGKVLNDYPVSAISREKLLQGKHLVNLYRTVELLIDRYVELCDEILDIIVEAANAEEGKYRWSRLGEVLVERRIERANRKLIGIAYDMREIATSLDGLLDPKSSLRQRLTDVLGLCVQVSVAEDFLLIQLGTPPNVPRPPQYYETAMAERIAELKPSGIVFGERASELTASGLSVEDFQTIAHPHIRLRLRREFEQLLRELDGYKMQLRDAIARSYGE